MKCVAVTQEGGELGGRIKLMEFSLFKTLLLVLDESDDESSQAQVSMQWCGAWCGDLNKQNMHK